MNKGSGLGVTKYITTIGYRVWRRELTAAVHLGNFWERFFLAFLLGLCVVFGGLVALLTSKAFSGNESIPQELIWDILMSSSSSMLVICAVVSVIFCIFAPQKSALVTMMDLLPVSRYYAVFGDRAIPTIAAVIFSLLLSLSGMVSTWNITHSILLCIVYFIVLFIMVCIVTTISTTLFEIIRLIVGHLFLVSRPMSMSLSAGVLFVITLLSFGFTLMPSTMSAPPLLLRLTPQGILATVIARPPDSVFLGIMIPVLGLAAYSILAIGFLILYVAMGKETDKPEYSRIFRNFRIPGKSSLAYTWIEFLVILRSPQATIALILLIPGTVFFWLMHERVLSVDITELLISGMSISGMIVVAQSFGRTMLFQWLPRAVSGKIAAWGTPKAIATFIFMLSYAAITIITTFGLGLLKFNVVIEILLNIPIAWSCALLAGILVPYNESTSVSAGFTFLTCAVLYLSTSYFLAQAKMYLSMGAFMPYIVFAVIGLLAFLLLARKTDYGELENGIYG